MIRAIIAAIAWLLSIGDAPVADTWCESRNSMPAVNCGDGVMHYDGCRWGCEPSLFTLANPITINGVPIREWNAAVDAYDDAHPSSTETP